MTGFNGANTIEIELDSIKCPLQTEKQKTGEKKRKARRRKLVRISSTCVSSERRKSPEKYIGCTYPHHYDELYKRSLTMIPK